MGFRALSLPSPQIPAWSRFTVSLEGEVECVWVGAVTNVVRTCSPTPLFVLTVCTKAIKYVRMNLKGPGKRYYIITC